MPEDLTEFYSFSFDVWQRIQEKQGPHIFANCDASQNDEANNFIIIKQLKTFLSRTIYFRIINPNSSNVKILLNQDLPSACLPQSIKMMFVISS